MEEAAPAAIASMAAWRASSRARTLRAARPVSVGVVASGAVWASTMSVERTESTVGRVRCEVLAMPQGNRVTTFLGVSKNCPG